MSTPSVCLDILRSRQSRREDSLDAPENQAATPSPSPDPEQEAVMADSVGLALLVVLEKLTRRSGSHSYFMTPSICRSTKLRPSSGALLPQLASSPAGLVAACAEQVPI